MLVSESTDLVDHIGQLTLHLIGINLLPAAEVDGGSKFGDCDSCTPDRGGIGRFRLGILKTTSGEDFSQQVAQADVVGSLKR